MPHRDEHDFLPALRFRRLTPIYDLAIGLPTRERTVKEALLRQAGIEAGHSVLDLACGTGTLAVRVKREQPQAEMIGVDGDEAILAMARRKAGLAGVVVQFDHALSHGLPYADARFDRVLSSLFFHHLTWENKRRTASEVFRILKPGGELHVADFGLPSNRLMRALFLPVQVLDGFARTRDNVAGRLVELFREAGLDGVTERRRFATIMGTMTLYSARRPVS